jgi:hypothetical protein
VYDATDLLMPGIFAHIERAGVHSGDSISAADDRRRDAGAHRRVPRSIAHELGTRGFINIQFVIHEGEPKIIEANPRASRTMSISRRRPVSIGRGRDVRRINKIAEGAPPRLDAIASRSVDFVINDAREPKEPPGGYRIRRAAGSKRASPA